SGVVTSNITRADYAGSQSCEPCHAEIYASWMKAPMHDMTRLPATVGGGAPFDGRVFHFKNDSATLETVSGQRYVKIASQKFGSETYRVTKVIGGHYREDFAGQQVDAETANARVLGDTHDELVLPVSWVLATKSLRYKGYSVMTPTRDALHAGPVWNRTCILCHNTAPYLSSMLGALAGPEAKAYQGEVVDPLLPRDRQWHFDVIDEGALKSALSAEVSLMHNTPENLDQKSMQNALITMVQATRSNFWEKDLLEVGIGCESCHGGSKEHVHDPKVKPSFSPHSEFAHVAGAHSASQEINRTCARCHQVLFSGYPFTWEGRSRNQNQNADGVPGGSHINSGEARDLMLGHCASQISCVDCHDPHAPGSQAKIHALEDTPAGNAVCVRCHQKFGTDAAVAAHTHHDPKGEGGKCFACHMPKKNMSLGGETTRYHRIGSPTDRDRVELDRPLECALCHEKKTVREILSAMKSFWNVSYDETKVGALYGQNLDQNAILATLTYGKPHEKAPA
ncbi:MAG: cytochrome c3 family protein, partial [Polyangiaceae bacterium]